MHDWLKRMGLYAGALACIALPVMLARLGNSIAPAIVTFSDALVAQIPWLLPALLATNLICFLILIRNPAIRVLPVLLTISRWCIFIVLSAFAVKSAFYHTGQWTVYANVLSFFLLAIPIGLLSSVFTNHWIDASIIFVGLLCYSLFMFQRLKLMQVPQSKRHNDD